jgi:hypothetical protein
MPDHQIPGKP